MKIIYKVFALMAVIAFVGCATTGGETKSKLSEADLQRMDITHGGYGNRN